MEREEIRTALSELIEDILNVDDLVLRDDATASDVEGWDSLSHIRIMATVERRFGIRFSNAEIEKLNTVSDLIGAIQAKLPR